MPMKAKGRRPLPARRKEFLRQITRLVPPEAFTPEEAWTLLLGRMREARIAFRAAHLRELCDRYRAYSFSGPVELGIRKSPPPRRPTTSLSRLNSSGVHPPL